MSRTPVLIIAEAGVNHNGDLDTARRLIDAAARAGADAVKFQTFRADEIVTTGAQKAEYQKQTSGKHESQRTMLRRLELDETAHRLLATHCRERGIEFLSTPFDPRSLDMLLDMGVRIIKIPSGEITNLPYLRHAGAKARPVIMSTGMATLAEIKAAVSALEAAGTPRTGITLLHCNTQYPTPFEDANLLAVRTLAREFPDCPAGYSDHTAGIACPIAAVALGARVIEKHFTLDRTMPGPDHAASIVPDELSVMVAAIREIELALGTGIKEPSDSERANIGIARRYLVATRPIRRGEPFDATSVAAKRTGTGGISPMRWDEIMDTPAPRDFEPGEAIEP
jgi:N,N'-diacetyllegionaminate synthase